MGRQRELYHRVVQISELKYNMTTININGNIQNINVRIHSSFSDWIECVSLASKTITSAYTGNEIAFISIGPNEIAAKSPLWTAGLALQKTKCWVFASADSKRLFIAGDGSLVLVDCRNGEEIIRENVSGPIDECVSLPNRDIIVVIGEIEVIEISFEGSILMHEATDQIISWNIQKDKFVAVFDDGRSKSLLL